MKRVFILLILALFASCNKNEYEPNIETTDYIELKCKFKSTPTKSSLLDGSEDKGSGVLILCFDGKSEQLISANSFSQENINSISLKLPIKDDLDFLVIGNLNYISTTDSEQFANIYQALGPDLPIEESDYESIVYRFDGAEVNAKYRRESYSEVAKYGIPYMSVLKGINVRNIHSSGGSIEFVCERLFAKLNMRIDCSSLTGGDADYFRNPKVYVRQANIKIRPFSLSPNRAISSEDDVLMERSDFDENAISRNTMQFSLYVPENMQGDLLPFNNDSMSKNPETLLASGLNEEQLKCLTYIEFCGEVDPRPGGYGGEVVYRFYPGSNAYSNFDLKRNKSYDILLSFLPGNLINDAVHDWKIVCDSEDNRLFCICPDEYCETAFASGQDVVIRPSRPAQFYVYMNPVGEMGDNYLFGLPIQDPSFEVLSVLDCAWTSNFMSETNKAEDVPLRDILIEQFGITPSYDSFNCLLSFTVTNPMKYNAHIGKSIILTLKLLPQGSNGNDSINFRLLLYPNMKISVDNSTVYPAMKRSVKVEGYYGDVLYKMNGPRLFKNITSDDSENYIPNSYSSKYCLHFCKDKYSSFQTLNCYDYAGSTIGNYDLSFCPTDSFNDGTNEQSISFTFAVLSDIHPNLPSIDLDLAGSWMDFHLVFRDNKGKELDASVFDPVAFKHIYTPILTIYNGSGPRGCLSLIDKMPNNYSLFNDEHLQIRETSRLSPKGYPIYQVSRKIMGKGSSYYSLKGSPKLYKTCMLEFIKNYYGNQISYSRSVGITFYFLPFMSDQFGLNFKSKYDDWSFCDDSSFDPQYKNCNEIVPTASGMNSLVYLEDMSRIEYYAKPTFSDSHNYNEKSQSVEISQQTKGGNIRIKTIDKKDWQSRQHSIGPHDAYVSVTNIHSKERIDEKIGSFSIYANLVVGGSLLAKNIISNKREFNVVPKLLVDNVYYICPLYVYFTRINVVEQSPTTSELSSGSSYFTIRRTGTTMKYGYYWNGIAYPKKDSQQTAWSGEISYPSNSSYLNPQDYSDYSDIYCSLIYKRSNFDPLMVNDSGSLVQTYNLYRFSNYKDGSGKGYYTIHSLLKVSPSSRGWVNNIYEAGNW